MAPGQMGHFEFWMKAPAAPGTFVEHFNLLAEWAAWMPDVGQNFTMQVVPPTYSWASVGQFAYSDQTMTTGHGTAGLLPGDRVYVGFVARNTGNLTWINSGPAAVQVATTGPLDRGSAFYDPSWLSASRPATMKEASVAPGQMGRFGFWTRASRLGRYFERFSLVAGSNAAHNQYVMNDPGLNFYMSVEPPTYAWQLIGQFAYSDQTMTTGHATTGLAPGQGIYWLCGQECRQPDMAE